MLRCIRPAGELRLSVSREQEVSWKTLHHGSIFGHELSLDVRFAPSLGKGRNGTLGQRQRIGCGSLHAVIRDLLDRRAKAKSSRLAQRQPLSGKGRRLVWFVGWSRRGR